MSYFRRVKQQTSITVQTTKEISIIGGGIQGLCCAYYLLQEGFKITVFEPNTEATGASYVNAGYLTPSHIIPLAAPGIIAKGLKWMLNSSSPFYVKPRWNTDFLRWSWGFYKSSTSKKVKQAIPVIKEINLLSETCFKNIKESGHLGDFQLENKGLLMLYKTQKAGKAEQAIAHNALDLGLGVTFPSINELKTLQPNLNSKIIGSILYRCDSHTTPTEVMPKLKNYLISKGVVFIKKQVTGFNLKNNTITALKTKNISYPTHEVVLAAGVWSSQLSKLLQLNIALEAGKGYKIDVFRETGITLPAILMEAKVAVTPMNGFTRFAGTMELSGINSNIKTKRVNAIAKAAEAYYTNLKITAAEKAAATSGMRPVSPDGLPYIGRTQKYRNLCLATGHAMMGWSLGPATGKLITEIITNKPSSMNLNAFNPDRTF